MEKEIYRVVTCEKDGRLAVRDFDDLEALKQIYTPSGVDDCSTVPYLQERKLPMFLGLIGPLMEGPLIVRYESPKAFEMLTVDWAAAAPVQRKKKRRSSH